MGGDSLLGLQGPFLGGSLGRKVPKLVLGEKNHKLSELGLGEEGPKIRDKKLANSLAMDGGNNFLNNLANTLGFGSSGGNPPPGDQPAPAAPAAPAMYGGRT